MAIVEVSKKLTFKTRKIGDKIIVPVMSAGRGQFVVIGEVVGRSHRVNSLVRPPIRLLDVKVEKALSVSSGRYAPSWVGKTYQAMTLGRDYCPSLWDAVVGVVRKIAECRRDYEAAYLNLTALLEPRPRE